MDGDEGFIILKGSPIHSEMQMHFRQLTAKRNWQGAVELTKERGIYNLYLQIPEQKAETDKDEAVEICPNDSEEVGGPERPQLRPPESLAGGQRRALKP